MSKRKTVKVDELVDLVNSMLQNSATSPEYRQGVINVIDHVLHETGNYKGFRYLMEDEVPVGQLPGVRGLPGDYSQLTPEELYELRFKDTDRTRVQY